MEEIILKLLVTDTEVIKQATVQLRDAFKNSQNIQQLYQLIVTSDKPQVRQYSALLLRKRFSKKKHWTLLPEEVKTDLKVILLQALIHESEKLVKNNITQLMGVIVKHELPRNSWPEVFQFIRHLLGTGNLPDQELGMYTLSVMTEIAPDVYLPHAQVIMEMLKETFNSYSNLANPVSCYILETMLNFVPFVEKNQILVNAYHQMMPKIMQTIRELALVNQEKTVKGFELLDELCESASVIITPHLSSLIEMCISIINDRSTDEDLKKKSIVFIGWLTKTKKKAIVKQKLVEPIIDVLFSQMCAKADDDSQEVYFGGDDYNTLLTSSTQTLNILALHLPPEKLVPHLLKHVEPGLKNHDAYVKKASYLSLAVLAEGCSEHIRSKYLESFLRCICEGINDSQLVVQNVALFALGQFSEYLQPNITQYADEILPVLIQKLGEICHGIRSEQKNPASADRMFYALETFAENLGEKLLPYLNNLMTVLFDILGDSKSPVCISELTLSAISAVAMASEENIMPYFQQIITLLEPYLNMQEEENNDRMCLQVQAVDCLGVLARNVGFKNFAPLAMKSLELCMNLLEKTKDPDLKKAVFGLLGSISAVMKDEIAFALPRIVDYLISSVKDLPLIDENDVPYDVYGESSEDEAEEEDIETTDNENDEDDENAGGYTIENTYIEVKVEAIKALRDMAEQTDRAFLPYLETSFSDVFKLLTFPHSDVVKAAIDTLSLFCEKFSIVKTQEGNQAMLVALSLFIPKLAEIIRLNDEREIVMEALDAYSDMLEKLESKVLIGEGHKDAIENCVMDVMLGQTACQDPDDNGIGDDSDEGEEAEHDEMMFECAGQVVVYLKNSVSSEDFVIFFRKVFPIFSKRLGPNNSDSQRSYSIGTILECLPSLEEYVNPFVLELLPVCLKLANDSCDEVRSNAIFGLGLLAFHGKELIYPHYFNILETLSNAIAKEKHAGTRDNIIGAIARMILANFSIIPLEQVFPVYLNNLPLKDDLEENKTVYKSILMLYKNGHVVIKSNLNHLLKVSRDILENKLYDNDDTKELILEFIKLVQNDFPEVWSQFCAQLTSKNRDELQKILI